MGLRGANAYLYNDREEDLDTVRGNAGKDVGRQDGPRLPIEPCGIDMSGRELVPEVDIGRRIKNHAFICNGLLRLVEEPRVAGALASQNGVMMATKG